MALFSYGPAEEEQVSKMYVAVTNALKPFRAHNVPAPLAVIALVRVVRAILRKMQPSVREPLTDAAKAYLAGETMDQAVIPFGGLFH